LERIKQLANDLAWAHGGERPATRALTNHIKRDIDAVLDALKRPRPPSRR
jgi:hypothetical protein